MTPERLQEIKQYAERNPEMDYEFDIRQKFRECLEEIERLQLELEECKKAQRNWVTEELEPRV